MELTPVVRKFVLHWGEMGERWGINRTVAQIHALLYLSDRPLPADEIAATLSVARSNVSTSIRELQSWGIIRTVQFLGDRRDHFESISDVWELFRVIMDERRRREIDPTVAVLAECVTEAGEEESGDPRTQERLKSLLRFMQTLTGFYDQFRALPPTAARSLAAAGQAGGKDRHFLTPRNRTRQPRTRGAKP